jgi:hypothetical protein
VCVEITPCRLLAPPCYESQQEFESQLLGHCYFDPWRATYVDTHHEWLVLEQAHEPFLQERLDKWLTMMRSKYEREARAWREKNDRLRTASLAELGIETEEERANRILECQRQLEIVESESPICGVPCKGRLKLTLADVKQGHEGLRDAWLHEDWARKKGENLVAMSRERRVFRKWLLSHTGTPANVFNARTRQRTQSIAPPTLGEEFESNPQFLEACAKVRYRARFADKVGTVVYLADCQTREELDALELDEVARLTGAPTNPEVTVSKVTAAFAAAGDQIIAKGEVAARAVATQLDAKIKALDEVISPINRLYAEPELAEIRKRAVGEGVPELFVDWVLSKFLASVPPRLPTKGNAFNHCGLGTVIGKKLKEAGFGISKQRFADHLTVLRRLLEAKGWLAPAGPGKSRKRSSNYVVDDRHEDHNQPNPHESAADRDDERQPSGLDIGDIEAKEAGGDPSKQSDTD